MGNSFEDRFWAKVDKNGPVLQPELGPCWVWTAGKDRDGYGQMWRSGKTVGAHRLSLEGHLGHPIPEGFYACHRCDNPSCVRPEHLFMGNPEENQEDARRKGRTARGGRSGPRTHPEAHRGERNGSSKLTADDVRLIREASGTGLLLNDLAVVFNVCPMTIREVVLRRTWLHVA